MTTKVSVTCPQDSHWDLKITAQDRSADLTWSDSYVTILGPGQTAEHFYVYGSRRYIIEETEHS